MDLLYLNKTTLLNILFTTHRSVNILLESMQNQDSDNEYAMDDKKVDPHVSF